MPSTIISLFYRVITYEILKISLSLTFSTGHFNLLCTLSRSCSLNNIFTTSHLVQFVTCLILWV